MQSPLLLLFNFSPERSSALREPARALGIGIRPVAPGEHRKPLNALLSTPASPLAGPAAPAFEGEMLVMAGFDRALMDRFLDAVRPLTAGVLKAVVTPTNLFWTGAALAGELQEERRRLKG